MPRMAHRRITVYASATERDYLLGLQAAAIRYFIDNQSPQCGLILDRQANFGSLRAYGRPTSGIRTRPLWSSAATGMGFIALALASASPHQLLSREEAIARIRLGLDTALHNMHHTNGVVPHFLDAGTGAVCGADARSTIDTGWLLAGALWAGAFLKDPELVSLAEHLFHRVDWPAWTAPGGLIRHGADQQGRTFPCCWDRLNGETVFLYVLAAGAEEGKRWPTRGWAKLGAFMGEVAGFQFASADLGLFVFQYGLDLLDLGTWELPGNLDLHTEAHRATEANARFCRQQAPVFQTYQHYWGLSASDGPGERGKRDTYRAYAPSGSIDGTACLQATLASLGQQPALVWENLFRARSEGLLGRYGLANVNLDRDWIGQDMVGIDAGAAVLALDNVLHDSRVRQFFHSLPVVCQGLERLGARQKTYQRLAV